MNKRPEFSSQFQLGELEQRYLPRRVNAIRVSRSRKEMAEGRSQAQYSTTFFSEKRRTRSIMGPEYTTQALGFPGEVRRIIVNNGRTYGIVDVRGHMKPVARTQEGRPVYVAHPDNSPQGIDLGRGLVLARLGDDSEQSQRVTPFPYSEHGYAESFGSLDVAEDGTMQPGVLIHRADALLAHEAYETPEAGFRVSIEDVRPFDKPTSDTQPINMHVSPLGESVSEVIEPAATFRDVANFVMTGERY